MCQVVFKLISYTISCLLFFRLVVGSCLTTQSDPGAVYLRQLDHNEDTTAAECQLVREITYTDQKVKHGELFDFIVVGAGSAGAVVANRLSENPVWRVLLLEAGGDPTVSAEVPSLFMTTINSSLDWQYWTEPEPTNCLGMASKRCPWPRGKVLGGTSTINAMLYVRGHPEDFNGWESSGSHGWNYKQMLPYFKKSEDMRSEPVARNTEFFKYHKKGGYLKIESFKDDTEFLREKLVRGFQDIGFQSFDDINAQHHEGFFSLQGTLENARKSETARSFLQRFQSRPNLKISKNSFVKKILINENKVAYGVDFTKDGKNFRVRAAREVILSGGSVNSPQLLMLSGIGPQEHLEKLGIPVVQNLKVGYNLQDHIMFRGPFISLDFSVSSSTPEENMYQFLMNSRGNFAGVGLFCNSAFFRTGQASFPNMQMLFAGFPANSTAGLAHAMKVRDFDEVIIQSMLDVNSKKFTLIPIISLLRPRSAGRILLKSKDPFDHPLIYPGYFSVDEDVEEIVEGVRVANKFATSKTLRSIGAQLERIKIPGCDSLRYDSDAYWGCVIKHVSVSGDHETGTCKMGARNSSDSVVDYRLRVIGVKHLRVADASIMPVITSGNTNAAIIAIGEKAADMIKQSWSKKVK